MYEQQSTNRTNTDVIFVQPYQLGFIWIFNILSLLRLIKYILGFSKSLIDARMNEYRMEGGGFKNVKY